MEEPIEGYYYLVKQKNQYEDSPYSNNGYRIAKFNGFGSDKGCFGMDWSGDTGSSADTWMHDDVVNYIPMNDIGELLNLGLLAKKF